MKSTSTFVMSIAVALFWVSTLAGQGKYMLDLTLPGGLPPPKSSSGCGPRLSAGSEGGKLVQPVLPVYIEIVRLNKGTYTMGQDLVCQISLKNVGDRALRIPWSPNPDYGNKDCTGRTKGLATAALTGSVALVLRSGSGVTRKILLGGLYGRLAIPQTYRTLEPGESASIKFKTRVVLYKPRAADSSTARLHLPQVFAARAEYDLDDTSQGNPYKPVYSKNRTKLSITGQ